MIQEIQIKNIKKTQIQEKYKTIKSQIFDVRR